MPDTSLDRRAALRQNIYSPISLGERQKQQLIYHSQQERGHISAPRDHDRKYHYFDPSLASEVLPALCIDTIYLYLGQRDLGSFISCCRAVFSLVCCMGGVGELLPTMGISLISFLS
jgi:hypothetical protein